MGKPVKKSVRWLVYLTPIIILAIYFITYHVILPGVAFSASISIIDWLFENPDNIAEVLKDPVVVASPILLIIGLKIIGWLLTSAFIASLVLVGYTIQNKEPKISVEAKFVGNEAYVKSLSLLGQIKSVTNQDVSKAQKAMQVVCDKLRNESDFGSGSSATINCENEIAFCFDNIESTIVDLYDEEELESATNTIEEYCQKILNELKIRIELKKK